MIHACGSKEIPDDAVNIIERFVILMFDRTSTCTKLDHAKRKLRGTDAWREVFLLNIRSRKKLVNVSFPAAGAELKSATSLPDADIADCRVRSGGRVERDVSELLHACD